MSIVSSTHAVGMMQACGRARITETHTDHLGNIYSRDYLALSDADYTAIRAAYAAQLAAQLAEEEAAQVING